MKAVKLVLSDEMKFFYASRRVKGIVSAHYSKQSRACEQHLSFRRLPGLYFLNGGKGEGRITRGWWSPGLAPCAGMTRPRFYPKQVQKHRCSIFSHKLNQAVGRRGKLPEMLATVPNPMASWTPLPSVCHEIKYAQYDRALALHCGAASKYSQPPGKKTSTTRTIPKIELLCKIGAFSRKTSRDDWQLGTTKIYGCVELQKY